MVMENGGDFENVITSGILPNDKPFYKGYNTSQNYPSAESERMAPLTYDGRPILNSQPSQNSSLANYAVYFQRKAELRLRPYTVNTWLLKEIYNPHSGEKVVFNYSTITRDYENEPSLNMVDDIVSMQQNRVFTIDKQLQSIQFPDGQSLVFEYSNAGRIDNPTFPPLASIAEYYKTQRIRSHEFTYGYLYKNQVIDYLGGATVGDDAEKRYLHLCLRQYKVVGLGGLEIPPQKFEYYLGNVANVGDIVPPRFTLMLDWYGYYNNSNWDYASGGDLKFPPAQVLHGLLNNQQNFSRNPYLKRAQNGLLKSIINPYGGVTELEYEQNEWANAAGIVSAAGGVRVSRISKLNADRTKVLERIKYKYLLPSGMTSGWGAEPLLNTETVQNEFFWDEDSRYGENIKSIKSENTATTIYQYGINSIVSIAHGFQAEAALAKAVDELSKSKVFAAVELMNNGGQSLSGVLSFGFAIFDVFLQQRIRFYDGLTTEIFKIVMSTLGIRRATTEYKTSTTKFFYPIHFRNPIGLHYSRVEVLNELENMGKVVYEYSRPTPSYLATVEQFSNTIEPRLNMAQVDLPVLVETQNDLGQIVAQKSTPLEQSYDIAETTTSDLNFLSCAVEVKGVYSAPVINSYTNKGSLQYQFSFPRKATVNLKRVYNRNFKNGTFISESIKDFKYDASKNLLRESESTGSDGVTIGTIYKYPFDYSAIGVYSKATDLFNIVGEPISTLGWLRRVGTSEKLLTSASFSSLEESTSGKLRVKNKYGAELQMPAISDILNNGINGTNPTLSPVIKELEEYVYDGNDLISTRPKNGIPVSVLFEDNSKFINNGTVANALPSDCRYTSFEGNNHNGWVFDAGGISLTKTGYTGQTSFCLLSPISTNLSAIATSRVLSFWATGNVTVKFNSAVQSVSINTQGYGGWQYYEYVLPGITGNIQITGDSNLFIDELRCYPSNARMNTKTYNMPFGVSSICDENNRISYNEYDGLGRLKVVRNHLFEVVKTFEYNFKQ